ncbi:MAG: hypothetical protein AUK55_03260 [Syntrophobacteraceae bacterium CG2_30_61_12]|nr:MAG: hypothetical protein AUK55_03260 [Syntrophobacteraceae bacterium CG2_30_61_12]PIU32669.1 MAG: hypothetical protein COT06_01490 [Syntrophobacteraceae bacterium CG07_land_8_20_14_0_80_61_8]
MIFRQGFNSLVFTGLLLTCAGCAGVGPHTVARDRFDYTSAISDSWKAQMLINMVKMRYGDTPTFLDVASVINQYSVESQVDLRFSWADPVTAALTNTQSTGGATRYIDRPTITYSPISGDKFARSFMTPIPPASILSLIQANYPVDLVFRLCVHSVNGIRNRFGGAARARPADPEFYPLLERMKRLQAAGAIGLRVQKTTEKNATLMTIRGKMDAASAEDSLAARRMLGLAPTADEFSVAYASLASNDREVAILSRSILEIIIDLASYIEVPEVHVEENRVNPTQTEDTGSGVPSTPLIRIHSSRDQPADAFAAVPYHGYWFWIDDRDLPSKRMFSFLMFIFTLVETGGKEGAPIVTIPAG